jgi:hypothetical protein
MTAKEALQFINESAVESKKKLDATIHSLHDSIDKGVPGDVKLDVRTFESIMVDVIKLKWAQQNPGTFLTCYVTGDDYNRISKAPYTYYMKTINGSLSDFISRNELSDFHIHSNGGYTDESRMRMFKKRLKYIEFLYLTDDELNIIAWCVDNVCI